MSRLMLLGAVVRMEGGSTEGPWLHKRSAEARELLLTRPQHRGMCGKKGGRKSGKPWSTTEDEGTE